MLGDWSRIRDRIKSKSFAGKPRSYRKHKFVGARLAREEVLTFTTELTLKQLHLLKPAPQILQPYPNSQ
ncbi:hypothetical protein PMI27_003923 [Pseudomonas sp. GM41(2012)]|nr:hypothetical protein PMI27_003923 [Pseudomonas sp. GM41(2012)]